MTAEVLKALVVIGTCCNNLDDEVNVVVKRVAEFLAAKNDIQRTERDSREVCLFVRLLYILSL